MICHSEERSDEEYRKLISETLRFAQGDNRQVILFQSLTWNAFANVGQIYTERLPYHSRAKTGFGKGIGLANSFPTLIQNGKRLAGEYRKGS